MPAFRSRGQHEPVLRLGARGEAVKRLQTLLSKRGYPLKADGVFGRRTLNAVKAFQSQNLDLHGEPLVVDGVAGPLTWKSLRQRKPAVAAPTVVDYAKMPPRRLGGSKIGREALRTAIGELAEGACEIGGDNRGRWVREYLHGIVKEPAAWCAGFVSWCFWRNPRDMPFRYTLGARKIMSQMKRKGWAHGPRDQYEPAPGDVVFWWRIRADGWQGHVGLVHQSRDGYLYTVEGNKGGRVRGCRYVLSRMEKLLGFGHVPDD